MSINPIDAITDMLGVVVLDLTALPAGLVAAGWTPPREEGEQTYGQTYDDRPTAAYKQGWNEGRKALADRTDPAHGAGCWIPVTIRWRHVRGGDVIAGTDGNLWMIEARDRRWTEWVSVRRGDQQFDDYVDPDETVTVLVPAAEAAARDLARNELGAKVVDRTV